MLIMLMLSLALIVGTLVNGQATAILDDQRHEAQQNYIDLQQIIGLTSRQLTVITHKLDLLPSSVTNEPCRTDYNPRATGHLVQQHYGGTTFFNRSWAEFKVGFGDASGNYWIGNERLHQLTKDGRYKLRVDLQARNNGQWYWAEYQTFRVGNESTQYRLEIGGYIGTAGNSLSAVNGMKFSTRDRDNDESFLSHCSLDFGGFWYDRCLFASVNSDNFGSYSFSWYHLPIGSGWPDKKLLSSRFTLLSK